jgi:type II secretory pathway component GspD/PulD (secretin)
LSRNRSNMWIMITLFIGAMLGCASAEKKVEPSFENHSAHNLQQMTDRSQSPVLHDVSAFVNDDEITAQIAALDDIPSPIIANIWFEMDLRQVLMDLSQETSIPIVWDSYVEGLVTYEAMDVPLTKVLEDILFTNGYVYLFRDGTYYVGSASVDNPSFHALSETRTIQLANILARDAVQLLPEPFKAYAQASSDLNMVSITAPPVIVGRIIRDLKIIDEPVEQIEIEVLVVEVSTSKMRKLGIDWDFSSVDWKNIEASGSISSPEIADAVLALDYFRSAMKVGGKVVDLTTSLKALTDAGIAKIRATPRLRTLSGRTAVLETLEEQYFFITQGDQDEYWGVYNKLETIQSGIRLEITPYADSMGHITVNVKPQVDDVVGEGAGGLPEISRRKADTTVRVKEGETITIGGLRLQNEKTVQKRVPILGEIPILGAIFGSTQKEVVESELVIFITPHVL